MKGILSVALLFAACATTPAATDQEPDEPGTIGDGKADGTACATTVHGTVVHVCNFSEVEPGIYRGARPDDRGLRDLALLGVHTDLDLEKVTSVVDAERDDAAAAGVSFVLRGMSYLVSPSDEQVDDILSIMHDPARQPVFVHCKLGNDRTGLVVGLSRIYYDGWSPADAWQEMLDRGFHRIWVGLSHYFEERTGYDD